MRKPGIDLINHTVGINPDLVYKKLELSVVDDANLARRIAIDEYINDEKEKSLQLLHSMIRGIEKLDNHIAELIQELDKKKDQKKRYEYLLESSDISTEKIKIASAQKDMPYILSKETEREVIRMERKRKLKEEEKEKERKKQKVLEMKGGRVVGGTEESEEVVDLEAELEKEHDKKVIAQQSEMLRSQEQIMQ